jgi:serpin B
MSPAGTWPAGANQETLPMHPSTLSRRRFLSFAGAAAAAPLFARFSASASSSLDDPEEMLGLKALARGINRFGCELNNRLTKDEPGSLFFSPFSIETALAMTAAGARGRTLEEMQQVLHLPPNNPHDLFGDLLGHLNGPVYIKPDPAQKSRPIAPVPRPYELTIANAIWAMKDFPWNKEFVELTRKNYGAGLVEVNFAESEAARQRINDWVKKETKDKIKDLIGPGVITALTRMVLANAIYFKGNWQYQFDKKYTRDAAFTRPDRSKVNVPLMHQAREFGYGEFTMFVNRAGESVQVLELPYSGRDLSMLIYLPQDPTGATRLAEWAVNGNLDQTALKMQRVKVWLPRFKAESQFLLNKPLKDLGMKTAFGEADFTGMSPDGKNLSITHVLHKAYVDVNEEGTEAAAATAVVVGRPSAPPDETIFRADRPFVYVIRDNKTGSALFMGRYSGPAL